VARILHGKKKLLNREEFVFCMTYTKENYAMFNIFVYSK